MVGLEYILNLYGMQHQQLAEKIGIKKQNINLWISGKQDISKKHLPTLSQIFCIEEEYFQKELDDIDKLIIQKEKLKKELKPEIMGYDTQLMLGENVDLIEKPIYNTGAMNGIELEIEKAKVVQDMREIISNMDNDIELQVFNQMVLLLKHHRKERIFEYTVDALSHYYDVLAKRVGDAESDEFVGRFIELAEKHDEE